MRVAAFVKNKFSEPVGLILEDAGEQFLFIACGDKLRVLKITQEA